MPKKRALTQADKALRVIPNVQARHPDQNGVLSSDVGWYLNNISKCFLDKDQVTKIMSFLFITKKCLDRFPENFNIPENLAEKIGFEVGIKYRYVVNAEGKEQIKRIIEKEKRLEKEANSLVKRSHNVTEDGIFKFASTSELVQAVFKALYNLGQGNDCLGVRPKAVEEHVCAHTTFTKSQVSPILSNLYRAGRIDMFEIPEEAR